MNYETVWSAVDNLAKSLGLTPSGLAKKSGLDSTTFNKSKRIRADGKKRWPSLDSLNKVLEFCNITFEEFCTYGGNVTPKNLINTLPFINMSKLKVRLLDNDAPDTSSWECMNASIAGNNTYGLKIDAKTYEPIYPENTILIICKKSEIRRGDRIIVFLNDGEFFLAEFIHRKAQSLELLSLSNNNKIMSVNINDILFVNKILWASQ